MDLKDTLIRLLGLEKIMAHLTGYVESRVALVRLEVREEVANLVSKGLVVVIIFFFAFLFLLFLSLAAAHIISQVTGYPYAGYGWVAGFYGCLFLIFLLARKPLQTVLEARMKELIKKREHKN